MECKEFHHLSESVLEGEAGPRAYAHLDACPRCRALVDELVAVTQAAHSLPVYEPSPRLWAQIQAAAVEEGLWSTAGAWRWRDWFGPAEYPSSEMVRSPVTIPMPVRRERPP